PARRAFGQLEQEVLRVLWASGEALIPREVMEQLSNPPAYTTVMTILDRLHRKGAVSRSPRGRAFAYEAVVSESAATSERLRSLLADGHDRTAVLQGFVDVLSEHDADELQRLLRETRRRRKPSEER
ncbi:MAG: CopY family transcriptional regulator, partial [Actinomycetia bacterium]|nr:CopY family transcriptional regulator [Actinomycetes bacterium]